MKETNLCSYVGLKSKVEAVRKGAFDDCGDRWNAYWAANLATLHGIGGAKHFLDGIRKLTSDDTVLLRYYVPAFFTGLTASLDCLALEIHLLVCRGDPSLKSAKNVWFKKGLKSKLECAAKCGSQKEAACIERLRECVLCSEGAKTLREQVFDWRNAYAHRSVVFSGYDVNGSAYLFDPNMEPGDIEKWVPPISPADQALLAKTGRPLLPLLGEYWQSARQIIDKSWSVMAEIVDVRMEKIRRETAQKRAQSAADPVDSCIRLGDETYQGLGR